MATACHEILTMQSAQRKTRRTILLLVAICAVDTRSPSIFLLHGRVELPHMVASRRLAFAIVAIDLKPCHADLIALIDPL